ncbi:MAG: DUF3310 domain-containing protein [Synergistaceae bacterium]|nr:DUF3310 domain-containing protein [Synergistaceae bacterium]MBR0234091.1 DUF3310 domain-containing protein [Synergistaceae bacterium]
MKHKKRKPYKITTLTNNDNKKLLEIHFFDDKQVAKNNLIANVKIEFKNGSLLEMSTETDKTIKPDYYKITTGLECIDIIEGLGLGDEFVLGNAIKYLTRAGKKYGETIDTAINKAVYYLERFLKNNDENKIREILETLKHISSIDDKNIQLMVIREVLDSLILFVENFRAKKLKRKSKINMEE